MAKIKKKTTKITTSSFFPLMIITNRSKVPLSLNKTCHYIYSKNRLCMEYRKNRYFLMEDQIRSNLDTDHSVKGIIPIRLNNKMLLLGEQIQLQLIPSMSCLSL